MVHVGHMPNKAKTLYYKINLVALIPSDLHTKQKHRKKGKERKGKREKRKRKKKEIKNDTDTIFHQGKF